MKNLFAACSIVVSLLTLQATAFAVDPNDPLSTKEMTCDISQQADFCGTTPITISQNSGCFEKVSVNGCKIVGEPSCIWGFIYKFGISTTQTAEQLCANQTKWCKDDAKHMHFTDCDEIAKVCEDDINAFRNQCMQAQALAKLGVS